jgi:hypothetical protein
MRLDPARISAIATPTKPEVVEEQDEEEATDARKGC